MTTAPLFDAALAQQHLEAIGIVPQEAHLRALHWNGGGAIDLPPGHPDRQDLEALQGRGYRLYLIAGGSRCDADVTAIPAIAAEWDGLSLEDTEGLLLELGANGLPDPTLKLQTWDGGSVHCWWRLDTPATDIDRVKRLMERLVVALGSDPVCINPSRLMRLAGGAYIATESKFPGRGGQVLGQAQILDEDPDAVTTLDELEVWIQERFQRHPELREQLKTAKIAAARTGGAIEPPTDQERLQETRKLAEDRGKAPPVALLPPRPLNVIIAALQVIPERRSGRAADDPYRHPFHSLVVAGLRDALYRLSNDRDQAHRQAVELMCEHVAGCKSAQVSQWLRSRHWLSEGVFWGRAKDCGWQPPAPPILEVVPPSDIPPAPELPTDVHQAEDDDNELIRDELRRIDRGRRLHGRGILQLLPPTLLTLFHRRAESLPVATEMLLPSFIATAASLYGHRGEVRIKKSYGEPLIFWLATIARPSSMKTEAAKTSLAPLQAFYDDIRRDHKAAMKAYEEAVKATEEEMKEIIGKKNAGIATEADMATMQRLRDNAPIKPEKRELFLGTATWEKLALVCSQVNVRGLVVRQDELSAWFAKLDKDPELRSSWLELWNAGMIKQDYKNAKSAYAAKTAVSLFGNMTPDVAAARVKDEAQKAGTSTTSSGDGMFPRMLWSEPEHIWPYPTDADYGIGPELLALYRQIDALPASDITITPDALTFLRSSVRRIIDEQKHSTPIREVFLGKLRGYLYRFAGLIAIIDATWAAVQGEDLPTSGLQVTAEQAHRARAVTDYYLAQFDALAPVLGRSDVPPWVEPFRAMAREAGGVLLRRDYQRKLSITATEAQQHFEQAQRLGLGQISHGRRKDQVTFELTHYQG